MSNPDDTLVKRQTAYTGEVAHEYHDFPGKYMSETENEYPLAGGSIPRVDGAYYVIYEGKKMILNREDESVHVDKSTLLKIDKYKCLMEYGHKCPVISAITTTVPKEKCETVLVKSPTQCLKPIIYSYPSSDAAEILNRIKTKIENKEVLGNLEAMELIMLPKKFTSNQDKVLEEVCVLLKKLKVEDELYKMELIYQMQCVIHKYAKTEYDIARLEEVIGMTEIMTARECRDQELKLEATFELAIKLKQEMDIKKIAELTDFSVDELEREEMIPRFLGSYYY